MSVTIPTLIITEAGLAAANAAGVNGPYIHISSFKVGSAFNYQALPTDVDLNGTVLYTGTPFAYSYVDPQTLNIVCIIDASAGPFQFGEVGLYLADGTLFAKAVYDTLQTKYSSLSLGVGSRYRFNCLLRLQRANGIFQIDTQINQSILEVDTWSQVVPQVSNPNAPNLIIVHEPDPLGQSPMIYRETDTKWNIDGYIALDNGAVVQSVSGNTITANVFLNYPTSVARRFLVQTSTGLIRSILNITGNTATLDGDIADLDATDVFSFYESTSTYYAKITSPNFLGTPTAPTAAVATKTTQIATTEFVHKVFPMGMAVVWTGFLNNIPEGYQLCDGTNGTPDYRDRFIVCAGGAYSVGDIGGADSVTLSRAQMPVHNHTGSTDAQGNHVHGIYDPGHSHSVTPSGLEPGVSGFTTPGGAYPFRIGGSTYWTSTASSNISMYGAGTHTHNVTVGNDGSGASHENRPPYYAQAWIRKMI